MSIKSRIEALEQADVAGAEADRVRRVREAIALLRSDPVALDLARRMGECLDGTDAPPGADPDRWAAERIAADPDAMRLANALGRRLALLREQQLEAGPAEEQRAHTR